jgi:hypothetical protein
MQSPRLIMRSIMPICQRSRGCECSRPKRLERGLASSQIKLLVSESQASGLYEEKASSGRKKRQRRGLLEFYNLHGLPSAGSDWTGSALPWLQAEVAHAGFSWLIRFFDCSMNGDPSPAQLPVGVRSAPIALF